jgi:hypothetical protein
MPNWPDDLSSCTLEEIFTSEIDNRAWYKELRLQNTALVNNRLAKAISQDEYTATRRKTTEEAAECKRRGAILVREITRRVAR